MSVKQHSIGLVHTVPFGNLSKAIIESITFEEVNTLREEIAEISMNASDGKDLGSDESFLEKLDAYRTAVGALWQKLSRQLDGDIAKAYQTTDSLWHCMWTSLVRRQLRPQKHHAFCGKRVEGYGGVVTYLANLPAQDALVKRWGCASWKEHVDKVWNTKNRLMEKEKEYRSAAIVISQIGVGVGGMLVGLLGFALSLVLVLVASVLN